MSSFTRKWRISNDGAPMNHKQKAHYIKLVLEAATKHCECENLHHKESDFHEYDYACPAEYRLSKAIYEVEKMLKEEK
jgi:hypothetical protein